MTKELIKYYFPKSKILVKKANRQEIREGWLLFNNEKWRIKEGILIAPKFSTVVKNEQRAIEIIDKRPDLGGNIQGSRKDYFEALESLPQRINNPYFKNEGAFLNISLGAKEYLDFINQLSKNLNILEIGADSCWSAAHLAQNNQVVALDINEHLFLRDFWLKKGRYFEAVKADMHVLPFKSKCFDLVFASASIHHSQDLKKVAQEFFRVLKPGGNFVFLREPMKGKWAKNEFGKNQQSLGVSENINSKVAWSKAFKAAGFKDLKIKLAYLDFPKGVKYTLRKFKKILLRNWPFLQELTISDYNFTGKKPKKEI